MKKLISIYLTITLVMLSVISLFSFSVLAESTAPSVSLDFTTMTVSTSITAEMLGAVDASTNYQVGLQDGQNTLYTKNGYNVTWMTWKLTAPQGKRFSDADLKIVGKICDYNENENLFGVFAYDTQPVGSDLGGKSAEAIHFENAYDSTMPNSGNYADIHDFDLSSAAAGKTEIYVSVMQMTTGSPEWIGYRSLSLTTVIEDIPSPSLIVSEDGLSIQLDFTAMPVSTSITAEMLGAVDASTNYQVGLQDGKNTLYTKNGYNVTWTTWKLTAPEGKQFSDADLQIVGKICDYNENENLFGVFVYDTQPVGSELGGKSAEAIHFENAYDSTMPNSGSYVDIHDFDLSSAAAGKTEIYVSVMQMTTGSPEWIGYRTLSLTAVATEIAEPTATPTVTPTTSPTVTPTQTADDGNPHTGAALPIAEMILAATSIGALMIASKKQKC